MTELEQLLDSVSDAVSVMVIFSNDAGSNRAVLRNLRSGAEGVKAAVNSFVDQSRETVALWNELGSMECATRMNECCDGLVGAINDIVNACVDIEKDPQDNSAKANLLEAGKDVIKQMVAILQFNDLYIVMVALNKIVVAQTLIEEVYEETWVADDFAELIRAICECIGQRFESTHDIRTKQMLEESKAELEKLGIGLATIVTRAQHDPKLREKIPIIVGPLNQAVQKATKAIKLTAKSPFDLSMLDTEFQYHDDDFIDEITVTTSDFHASLNAIKKAVKSGDEFEMERAIRVIESDLKAEIAAAEELAEETLDPILRAQMMAKIKQAKAEMGILIPKLTAQAKEGLSTGDVSKIDPLLDSAYKLFGSLFEGTALKEIMIGGNSLDSLFNELIISINNKDSVEAIALTKDIDREIQRQAAYGVAIADLIGDPYRKQRILGDVERLKEISNEITEITPQALQEVDGAMPHLLKLIDEARNLETDFITASSTTTENELLDGGLKITQALQDLIPLVDHPQKNKDLITTGLTGLLNKMKNQTNMAVSWADTLTDASMAERIKGISQQLRSAAAPLAISIKKCLATNGQGPEFENAKKEFNEAADKFINLNNMLVAAAVQSPDTELEALQGKLALDIKRLQEAMASRDIKLIAAAMAELKKDARGMIYLASLLSTELEDPELQRMLQDASNSLSGKLDGLLEASKRTLKNPSDKNARKKFENCLADFEATIDKLVHVSDSATLEDQMSTNALSLVKLAKKFAREAEQNNPQSLQSMQLLRKKVDKQQQLANNIAKRCDFSPELGDKIVKATMKLDGLLLPMDNKAEELRIKPGDKQLITELQQLTMEFCEHTTLTGTLAQEVKNAKREAEERAKEEARLAEERAKREAEEKQRQVPEAIPVGIKEVWMDAQQLVTLISESNLLQDTTPVGSLVALADKLARAMQELAALSRNGTKNQIITVARQIAGMVEEIGKYINEVVKDCRDPILNREMMDMGHVAKNYAVQLKILCGVKAGLLLDEDKETAQSLILCAKGLCKSVGEVVNRAQIAKLKPVTQKPVIRNK